MVDVTSKWDEERTAELHRGAGSQCGSQASMEGSGGIWTTQNFSLQACVEKDAQSPRKVSKCSQGSIRLRRIITSLWSFLFQVLLILLLLLPSEQQCSCTLSSVALASNHCMSLQLEVLLETALNFRACCCSIPWQQ